jgi:hypothetical protein
VEEGETSSYNLNIVTVHSRKTSIKLFQLPLHGACIDSVTQLLAFLPQAAELLLINSPSILEIFSGREAKKKKTQDRNSVYF